MVFGPGSLRVYGSIVAAIVAIIVVVNIMTVHRHQRELAEQRKHEQSELMHNRRHRNNNKKNRKSDVDADSTLNTETSTTPSPNAPETIDEYFENQQLQADKKKELEERKKEQQRKLHSRQKKLHHDQPAENLEASLTWWQKLKMWFGYPVVVENNENSATSNNNSEQNSASSTASSGSGGSNNLLNYYRNNNNNNNNINDDLGENFGENNNNDNRMNGGQDDETTNNADTENNNYNNNNEETDKLKSEVQKLKDEQEELKLALDEYHVRKRRNNNNNKKGNNKKQESDDEDQEDDDKKKNGINIKINLNTGRGRRHNDDDEDDYEDEDENYRHHHSNRRNRKNQHHPYPRRHRLDKRHGRFGEADLNEANYVNGQPNTVDREDIQVLDQANREIDNKKRDDGEDVEDDEEFFDEQDCPGYPSGNGLPFMSYETMVQQGRIFEPRYAYVTYITSAEFALPAAVLMYSIANTGSQYARVICVSSEISQRDRALLGLFAQIIEIDKIPSPLYVENVRYRDTFTKLRMWQLEMFTKALYIDTDVIIHKNIDLLFDLDEWSVPMDAEEQRYSTGMMLLAPSYKTFAAMMYDLNTTQVSMELPDLLFLKEFFEKRGTGTGLSYDDVPELKSSSSTNNNNNNNNYYSTNSYTSPRAKGTWQWKDGKWTYNAQTNNNNNDFGGGGGGYSIGRKRNVGNSPGRGVINIIPRWFQVYHIEFGSLYHSYLTHRLQKLTIHDPRIYGIHYPGNGKPWQEMAKKLRKFSRYMCHPEMPEARVRWRYQPEFIWYVYYSMMKRSLKKIERGLVGSPIFETERGKTIILRDYIAEQVKKRKDEEKYSNYYSSNNNDYYNNNNYNTYNSYNTNNKQQSSDNTVVDNTNNNKNYLYNKNPFARSNNNNNNGGVGDNAAAFCFDCPKFVPSACLLWNLTSRTPPGIVLFEDEGDRVPEEDVNEQQIHQTTKKITRRPTTTSTSTSDEEEITSTTTSPHSTFSPMQRYKSMYEKYYGNGGKNLAHYHSHRTHNYAAATTTTSSEAAASGSQQQLLEASASTSSSSLATAPNNNNFNNNYYKIVKKDVNDDPKTQPQSFDEYYVLTSQARPIFDLSTLNPLILNLPQKSILHRHDFDDHNDINAVNTSSSKKHQKIDQLLADTIAAANKWEMNEKYSWVISWCTRTLFRAPADAACGQNAFVSQYSGNVCRANFFEKFSIHRFGKVPALLWVQNNTREVEDAMEDEDEKVATTTTSTSTSAVAADSSNEDTTKNSTKVKKSSLKKLTPTTTASSSSDEQAGETTTTKKKPIRKIVKPTYKLVQEYQRNSDDENNNDGVVIRSAVRLENPSRTKWIDVVIRCDWNMTSETEADFDLDHPAFKEQQTKHDNNDDHHHGAAALAGSSSSSATVANYFAVLLDNVKPPHDRRYKILLKSRCACPGGCGLAKLWNETYDTETAKMREEPKDEWARNVTGMEPTVDDLFPTTTTTSTTLAPTTTTTSNSSSSNKKMTKTQKIVINDEEVPTTTTTTTGQYGDSAAAGDLDEFSLTTKPSSSTTTTTTTTTTRPPPRTTKPFENQTLEERLRVQQVTRQFSITAWSRLSESSTLHSCMDSPNDYVCGYSGNSMFGRCQWIKEVSPTTATTTSTASSHHDLDEVQQHQQHQTTPAICLPRYNQTWILVASKTQKKVCNCTHVGGDDQLDISLDACLAKAAAAGANVVNYGGPKKSSSSSTTSRNAIPGSLGYFFQHQVDMEGNLTKMRRERKRYANSLHHHDDQHDEALHQNEKHHDEHVLSHAERVRLARKRREEAARKARVPTAAPPTTTKYSNSYYNSNNNNYNSNGINTNGATGIACYFKKCSTSSVLKEKISLTKDPEGYYVFVKNLFYVNASSSSNLLL